MAKKQTRRSISVKGSTYRRFKIRCEREGVSVSGAIEDLLAPLIEGIEDPGAEAYPLSRRRPQSSPEEIASQHFTF